MITWKAFQELALSFPHTEQVKHFEREGFKVTGRRMFATYLEKDHTVNVFLTPAEQQVFCAMSPGAIFPVPNKWGEKGATTFVLERVEKAILQEALASAYNDIVKPKK